MFDIGWMEMLLIAVVAIVVIGPKDLPKVLHTVGQWMGRARAVARNFQDQMEEMARQSGVDDVRQQIQNSMSGVDPAERIRKAIDPTGEMDAQMKAMTDLGRLDDPTPAPAKGVATAEEVETAVEAQAGVPEAVEHPHKLPDDLIAEDKKPQAIIEPDDTAYKGPRP
ncbi:MAG TPA: Sec-independent protein translocase protein TatB [Alphaproteobacteria bacterium]|nr:Sec-independent protein translocase protein TatB [Alphaproteobacteria bacterium]